MHVTLNSNRHHLSLITMVSHVLFPSLVFQENLGLNNSILDKLADYVADCAGIEKQADVDRITADNSEPVLHQDPNLADLFSIIAIKLQDILFRQHAFSKEYVSFHIGRSWPVVSRRPGGGEMHFHGGATFSGSIYLRLPEGAGGLAFVKPDIYSADRHPRTLLSPQTALMTELTLGPGDMVFFNSELRHRAMPSANMSNDALRIAVGFDVFALGDIRNPSGGMPQGKYLRSLDSFLSMRGHDL